MLGQRLAALAALCAAADAWRAPPRMQSAPGAVVTSELVRSIAASRTIEIHALTKELEAQGEDVVSLCVGEPDFSPPDNVLQAVSKAALGGKTKYTAVNGDVRLREAICEDLLRRKGTAYDASQVVVANGAKQAIYQAVLAVCDPGDEVIVPAPYWPSYPEIVKLAGATPVIVPTRVEDDFKITPEQLRGALTARTRMLMLCNPVNPTGSMLSGEEQSALAAELSAFERVWVLADEIYERIAYGAAHESFCAIEGGSMMDRTLLINGFSKSHSMTGFRVGYLASTSAEVVRACTKLQSQLTSCASSIGQEAAIEALRDAESDAAFLEGAVAMLRDKRDMVCRALREVPGLTLGSSPEYRPEGAFYVMPNVEPLLGRSTPSGERIDTSHDLCVHMLKDHKVAVVPGEGFGCPGTFRVSYATSVEELEAGMERIVRCLTALS